MKKSQRKGHITRTRNRYAKEVGAAWKANTKCYVILKVVNGPSHAILQEDWWKQRADHKAFMWLDLKIMYTDGNPVMRSERHGCIGSGDTLGLLALFTFACQFDTIILIGTLDT